MAQYCITMEQTFRIAKWFEAANDEVARTIASDLFYNTDVEEYMGGSSEDDYALESDDGRTIIEWG